MTEAMNCVRKICAAHLFLAVGAACGPLVALLLFSLLAARAAADELPPVAQVVAGVQQVYERTVDLKAFFRQESAVASLRRTEREEGQFYFRRPSMLRWNYTKPQPKYLILNEQQIWLYVPADRVAYVQNTAMALKSRTLLRFLAGVGKIAADFDVEYSQPARDSSGNYLLTLKPKAKDWGVAKLYLAVDPASYYIRECRFTDLYDNTTRIIFDTITADNGLPVKLFRFKPPAGVEVMQLPQ